MTSGARARATLVAVAATAAMWTGGAAARHDPTTKATRRVDVQAARKPTKYGELRFLQRRLTVGAGRVTFVFTNPATLGHNLAIRRGKRRLGATPTIARGATRRLTLRLTAGRYTFYCAVPGHEAAGMRGPLTVR
ncbi:MAG TPA: plastocyanin/azurin family copper-binding protein [Solirubrobacteraceae bacterium]|jgi:uncharacterized cupredoxin-like copper-binding protein